MNEFTFTYPTKVYFGENVAQKVLKPELDKVGKTVMLAYGGGSIKANGIYDEIAEILEKAGKEIVDFSGIMPNPTYAKVQEGAALAKEKGVDFILAVGGGSVIDCAKLVAAGAYYEGDAWDLVCGKARIDKALPIVCVLTLSATGSEMDASAVISNPDTQEKLLAVSSHIRPQVAFLDPTLTYSVSAFQTACGSADILSHIMEVYFDLSQDLELLDREMEGMMKTVIQFAPVALANPQDYRARANLMWASSWAINGFFNGGKQQAWSCHPMEHELSAFYDIAHGLGLAILTPRWMEYVLDETTVSKFYTFGTNVFGIDPALPPMEVARQSIQRTRDFLFGQLGLDDTLTKIGIDDTHFERMAEKACAGGAIPGFKHLTKQDVVRIYQMCL